MAVACSAVIWDLSVNEISRENSSLLKETEIGDVAMMWNNKGNNTKKVNNQEHINNQ